MLCVEGAGSVGEEAGNALGSLARHDAAKLAASAAVQLVFSAAGAQGAHFLVVEMARQ